MEIKEDDDLVIDNDEVIEENIEVEENEVEEEVVEESDASEETEPETIQDDEDEEDRIVTIGDAPSEEEEEQPTDGRNTIKKLRKTLRGYEKKHKALLRQIEENEKAAIASKPIEVGEEPTLKSCNYSEVEFKKQWKDWDDRKKQVEAQEAEQKRLVEEQNKAHQAKVQRYVESKQEHKFKDFDEAEDFVKNTLNVTQQGILVEGAKDAALLTYALGKNPKKLEELANIKNHIEFAFELARVEAQLKVSSRKPPSPEKRMSSNKSGGGTNGNTSKELDRLRAKAEKTGDYSAVVRYKKQHGIK